MKSYERSKEDNGCDKLRERERFACIGEVREEIEDGEGIYRGLEREREGHFWLI